MIDLEKTSIEVAAENRGGGIKKVKFNNKNFIYFVKYKFSIL